MKVKVQQRHTYRTSPKQQLCGTSQNHAKLGICVGVRRCSGGPRQETVSSRLLSMMDVCALLAFCLLTLAHTITSTKVQIFLQPPLLVCPSSSNAAEASLLERDFHCFYVGDALCKTKVKTSPSSSVELEWFRRNLVAVPVPLVTSSICFPRWSSALLFFTSPPQLHTIYGIFTTRLNKSSAVRHPHRCASFWRLLQTTLTLPQTHSFIPKRSFRWRDWCTNSVAKSKVCRRLKNLVVPVLKMAQNGFYMYFYEEYE